MLSSDSPGTLSLSLCQNHQASYTTKLQISHAAQLSMLQLSRCHLFSHAYHYCQEPYRLHLPNLSYSNGSQVSQPCNDLWYLPKICSRISQICLCISVSNSLRWSRNIAMMSRWFAFRRTSSSNGKSHSMRTSTVCISRNTLVTFSKPIIQPMYCSSIASRNGRLSRRLSILSPGCMAILSLILNASVPTKIQWFLNSYFQRLLGQLSESLLSKHSTCVSRTYSQPQPVEILSMFISRQVVGVFTVQTPHLCLQDLLPTSACRDTPIIPNMSSPAINWQVTFNEWPYSQHATKMKWDKNTSHKSRILKLFDALDFTSAMYQSSDHFRTLVQAQHRSRENPGAQYKRSQLHLRWCP